MTTVTAAPTAAPAAEKPTRVRGPDKLKPMKQELSVAFTAVLLDGNSTQITALVDRLVAEDPIRGKQAWEAVVIPSMSSIQLRNPPLASYLAQLGARLDQPARSAKTAGVLKVANSRLITYFQKEEILAFGVGPELGGFRKTMQPGPNGRTIMILEPVTVQEYEAIVRQAQASAPGAFPRAA